MNFQKIPIFILVLAAILFLQSRVQLLSIPLERDEGAFAYVGHWMFRGEKLYTDLGDNKPPLLYGYFGMATSLFGYNARGVHLGLLLSNIFTAIFLFLFTRELFNKESGLISAAFFLVMIVHPGILGFAAHATQILLPFLMAALWMYWRGVLRGKEMYFLLSGILVSLAFLVKQQAALFGVMLFAHYCAIFFSSKNSLKIKHGLALVLGGILPIVLVLIYFLMTSRLHDLVFWMYTQPMQLASKIDLPVIKTFFSGLIQVAAGAWWLWLLAIGGTVIRLAKKDKLSENNFVLFLMMTGLLSVMIGAGFYRHYYVVVIPAIALGAGAFLGWLIRRKEGQQKWIATSLAVALLLMTPALEAKYYFKPDHNLIHQRFYFQNMFPEMEWLGQELSKRVDAGKQLIILGSEPEILVAANRKGCSQHLMTYTLLVDLPNAIELQEHYFNENTTCNADYLVFNVFSSSWFPGFESLPLHQRNMEWIQRDFIMEGIAEYREGKEGLILWGDEARTHRPQSSYIIYVFKRK